MIVDFSVRNFRSIKNEQTLCMWTDDISIGQTNRITKIGETEYYGLPSVGIYGANAAGKSNLLKALKALSWMVLSSARLNDDEDIPCYTPFRLSVGEPLPTSFKVEYYIPKENVGIGTRYRYELVFTKKRIQRERLCVVLKDDTDSLVFLREGDATSLKKISWGDVYRDEVSQSPDVTFLSQQTVLSVCRKHANTPNPLRIATRHLGRELEVLSTNYEMRATRENDAEMATKIGSALLPLVDTGVIGASYKSSEMDPKMIEGMKQFLRVLELPASIVSDRELSTRMSFLMKHKREDGSEVGFDLEDESDGTQKIFSILPKVALSLCKGSVLAVDELERSVHPFLAEIVLKLFNDKRVNCNGAQLIYTTHDTNLMSQELLRKDQIWFVEKNTSGASTYFSLSEFNNNHVKTDSPFIEWYLQGRFGGVPIIDYNNIRDAMVTITNVMRSLDAKSEDPNA